MTMFPQKFDYEYCSASIILELISSKWSVVVLQFIKANVQVRFNDVFRGIPKISEKVLAQTLDLLEWNGLIEKIVYVEAPPHTEYRMLPLGDTLIPLLNSLKDWCDCNFEVIMKNRNIWEQKHG